MECKVYLDSFWVEPQPIVVVFATSVLNSIIVQMGLLWTIYCGDTGNMQDSPALIMDVAR
jgi:hypothetical protein